MVIAADTSFLFSVYGYDCHTAMALQWSKGNLRPIFITPFNEFELINALRFAECRKGINPGEASRFIRQFQADIHQNRLVRDQAELSDILAEAHRLSSNHTLTGGHRAFDVLHVAAASLMKATHFLTFDANQKRLAENEGLTVPV